MTSFKSPAVNTVQNITFPIEGELSAAVVAETVVVYPSPGDHKNGSSKVKLCNLVDYSWEERYYPGQLLTVHMEGKFIAYSIKDRKLMQEAYGTPGGGSLISPTNKGAASYAVRIVKRDDSGKRALIKCFGGAVEDIAFAYVPTQVTLAYIDETGSVFVHNIFEDSKDIAACLLLQIVQTGQVVAPRRIFWCPFIPDEADEDPYTDETALLLAVTRDTKIEIWNVSAAASSGSGPYRSDTIPGACVTMEAAHDSTIVAAALSPDGTAIATASTDGECKFFQVYLQGEGEPTCLHQWKPHGGKPVTSLLFLDDHKCGNPETKFWRYALTGTDDNNELCLWTCETWKCLQTIRFHQTLPKKSSKLKVSVDLSSGFVFVSDMFRRLLYVLELERGDEETVPYIRTVTELTFSCPILSLAIVHADIHHIPKGNVVFTTEDIINGEDEELTPGVRARLYLVQPRSLQECHILFPTSSAVLMNSTTPPPLTPVFPVTAGGGGGPPPPPPVTPPAAIAPSQNGILLHLPPPPPAVPDLPEPSLPPLNLMTPDAFHSPQSAESTASKSRKSGGTPGGDSIPFPTNLVIPNGESALTKEEEEEGGGGTERGGGRLRGLTSGGSSPSREVEEILASSPSYFTGAAAGPQAKPTPGDHSLDLILPLSLEMSEKLKVLECSVAALRADVQSITHALDSNLQELHVEMKKNRGTSLSEVEGAITQAVSTYKPVSEQDIVAAITPLISQAVLSLVNPAVIKSMSDLHNMVHGEVAAKLTSTDVLLRENISKLVKSKTFSETLARSFSQSISSTMETVFREAFTRTVVPMFEAACSSMFTQMSDTFSKGINETIKTFDEHANSEAANIQTATEQFAESSQKLSATIEKETRSLEERMLEVERRLKTCLSSSGGGPGGCSACGLGRSGTATPALGCPDPAAIQSQVSLLIKQGQYNAAFQQALSASDLNIVSYACDRIEPSKVFTKSGSLLQQHVLLSLIQQLAADMSSHTDTKQKYLEAAVMNLIPNNENTREHMPGLLASLQKQLVAWAGSTTDSALASKAKLLAMACQQLLRDIKENWD